MDLWKNRRLTNLENHKYVYMIKETVFLSGRITYTVMRSDEGPNKTVWDHYCETNTLEKASEALRSWKDKIVDRAEIIFREEKK